MPELDLSRRIVYRFDAPPHAVVRTRVVYKQAAASELVMDVYAPAARTAAARSAALVFVHGGPIPREMLAPTEWGVFASYCVECSVSASTGTSSIECGLTSGGIAPAGA